MDETLLETSDNLSSEFSSEATSVSAVPNSLKSAEDFSNSSTLPEDFASADSLEHRHGHINLPEQSTEDKECRVCGLGQEEGSLYHPCKCAGSIKYVHQHCLQKWLEHSKKVKCELCGEEFTFQNVYSPHMPSELSWWEIVSELSPKLMGHLKVFNQVVKPIFFLAGVVPIGSFFLIQLCINFIIGETLYLNIDKMTDSVNTIFLMWFTGLAFTVFVSTVSSNISFLVSLFYATDRMGMRHGARGRRIRFRRIGAPGRIGVPVAEAPMADTLNEVDMIVAERPIASALDEVDVLVAERPIASALDEVDVLVAEAPIAGALGGLDVPVAEAPIAGALGGLDEALMAGAENSQEGYEVITDDSPSFPVFSNIESPAITGDLNVTNDILIQSDYSSVIENNNAPGSAINSSNWEVDIHEDGIPPLLEDCSDDSTDNSSGFDGDNVDNTDASEAENNNEMIPGTAREGQVNEIANGQLEPALPQDLRHLLIFQQLQPENENFEAGDEFDAGALLAYLARLPSSMNPFNLKQPENIVDWMVASAALILKHALILLFMVAVPIVFGRYILTEMLQIDVEASISVLNEERKATRELILSTLNEIESSNALYQLDLMTVKYIRENPHIIDKLIRLMESLQYWFVGAIISVSTVTVVGLSSIAVLYTTGQIQMPGHPFTRENYNRLMRLIHNVGIIGKISTCFLLEVVLVPHIVGWIMDLVTIRTVGGSVKSRVSYYMHHPITCSFLHTVLGFLFLAHLSSLLIAIKDALLPRFADALLLNERVLTLLNNLNERDDDLAATKPWKEILYRPLVNFLYIIPAICIMVFIPVRFGHYIVFHKNPILMNFEEIDYSVQVPLELIVFHVFLPFLFERFRYRETLGRVINKVFRAISDALGLSSSVLRPERGQDAGAEIPEVAVPPPRYRAVWPMQPGDAHVIQGEPIEREVPVPDNTVDDPAAEATLSSDQVMDAVADDISILLENSVLVLGDPSYDALANRMRDSLQMESNETTETDHLIVESGLSSILHDNVDPYHPPTENIDSVISTDEIGLGPVSMSSQSLNFDIAEDSQVQINLADGTDHENARDIVVEDISHFIAVLPSTSQQIHICEKWYSVRLLALLISFLCFVIFCCSAAIYIPLLCGREVMIALRLNINHDFYNICMGYAAILTSISLVKYVIDDISSRSSVLELVHIMAKYFLISVKGLLLGLTWTGAVPFLIGLSYELTIIIPVQNAYNESPRISILHCWALGFVFTKIWMRCVVIGMMGETYEWKRRFDRVINEGLTRISFSFIFIDLMLPVLVVWLDTLLIPYFLGSTIGYVLKDEYLDYFWRNILLRYSYLTYATLKVFAYLYVHLAAYATKTYNEIRDSKYLLARQLTNR